MDRTKKYFEERCDDEDNDEDVSTVLNGLIKEFLKKRSVTEDMETFFPKTESELNMVLKRVSRPNMSNRREPSPWPVIQKVVIHQNLRLLNLGITLANTLGITDTNLAVVENTKRYLKQAGTILIFLNYQRIVKSPLLDKLLRQYIQFCKMNETRLVITKIDDMKAPTENSDEDMLDPTDIKRLAQAKSTLADLTSECAKTSRMKIVAQRKTPNDTLSLIRDSKR